MSYTDMYPTRPLVEYIYFTKCSSLCVEHMMFDSFVDCALIKVYVGPEEGTKRAVYEEGHWDGCITGV